MACPPASAHVTSPVQRDHDAAARLRILALAPNEWNGPWMNRQQLLSRIGRQHDILYSTGPVARSRTPDGSSWTGRLRRQDNVLVDTLPPWVAWTMRRSALRPIAINRIVQRWKAALGAAAGTPLMLWSFHPKYRPFVSAIAPWRIVYHAFDLYHLQKEWTTELAAAEDWFVRHADFVIASSTAIAEYLSSRGARSPEVIENAADYHSFAIDPPALGEPADLAAVPRPRIGYTGALNRKVDFPLLLELSERQPAWQIVLVGALGNLDDETAAAVSGLRGRRNVHFLGFKDHRELPHYVGHMDVNLLAYRLAPHLWTQGIYPLKLHEYLAAGRPVVSADLPSVRRFGHVVNIVGDAAAWERGISAALTGGATGTLEMRRAVARANGWDTRAAALEPRLRELGNISVRAVTGTSAE